MDKHDVIVQAVEKLKKSEFGTTAIKVELEAQLDRMYGDSRCGNCHRGRITCPDCDGCWESEHCYNCADGSYRCDTCDGEGRVEDDGEMRTCQDCDDGWVSCEECDGSGETGGCEYCEEGDVDCPDCEDEEYTDFSRDRTCQDFILQEMAEEGLATYDGDKFVPQWPLVFARFYNDGSVDSELTFTLALDDPENVFLLPKFIDAFNKLADAVGNEKRVTGAGMHMALINSEDCSYPTGCPQAQKERAYNFAKSMNALMPALYFLGSSNNLSRPMNYRRPGVGVEDKYKTISYRNGSLEFRFFETCYDKPETILDNVVVMSKTMKYWKKKFKPVKTDIKQYKFGIDSHGELERMYVTMEHLELLNKGLELLKPDYYTIREIKQQRGFKRTRAYPKKREAEAIKDAELAYKEYENRFAWQMSIKEIELQYDEMRHAQDMTRQPSETDIASVQMKAAEKLETYKKEKKNLEKYVEEKVKQTLSNIGQYKLEVA